MFCELRHRVLLRCAHAAYNVHAQYAYVPSESQLHMYNIIYTTAIHMMEILKEEISLLIFYKLLAHVSPILLGKNSQLQDHQGCTCEQDL